MNKQIYRKVIASGIITAFVMVTSIAFIHAIAKAIDARGDEMCASGAWRGEELCPPERSNGKW